MRQEHITPKAIELNREDLIQKYWHDELSLSDIGKLYHKAQTTILFHMNKLHIPRRPKAIAMRTESYRIKKGEEAIKRFGKKGPSWKGGVMKSSGYIWIYSPSHPNRKKGSNHVKRCILIAENILGRHLKRGEMVHHINLDRADDRNSNLLICTRKYHSWLHNKMNHWSRYRGEKTKDKFRELIKKRKRDEKGRLLPMEDPR